MLSSEKALLKAKEDEILILKGQLEAMAATPAVTHDDHRVEVSPYRVSLRGNCSLMQRLVFSALRTSSRSRKQERPSPPTVGESERRHLDFRRTHFWTPGWSIGSPPSQRTCRARRTRLSHQSGQWTGFATSSFQEDIQRGPIDVNKQYQCLCRIGACLHSIYAAGSIDGA